MGHQRKDVDDAARLAGFDQMSDHPFHQQERTARIGAFALNDTTGGPGELLHPNRFGYQAMAEPSI
jgi:hypothetical protein